MPQNGSTHFNPPDFVFLGSLSHMLKEPNVLLRCRKDYLHFVEIILDSANEEYSSKVNVHEPEIIVDDVHLPHGSSHHQDFFIIMIMLMFTDLSDPEGRSEEFTGF